MRTFLYVMLILGTIAGCAYAYDYVSTEVTTYFSRDVKQQEQIAKLLTREQELQLELSLLQEQLKVLHEENKKLELQLQIDNAKSNLELAQGQRSILEAAANTVDTNSWLVAWNAVRGDVILILVLVFLLALIILGAVFGMSIYIRMRRRDTKMEIILPTYKIH